MRKDRVFINAVCKAEEVNLLSADALNRLSAASFEDCLKMLHDYGYNEGVFTGESLDIDAFISRQVDLLIAFVKEYSPNAYAEDFLLAPYLFSDLKAECKFARGGNRSVLYNVDTQKDDPVIARTVARLNDVDDPRKIDLEFTKALYEYKRNKAKKSGFKLLSRFVAAEIDTVNIMTAQRMKRMGSADNDLFIEGGTLDKFIYEKSELPSCYEEFELDDPIKLETQAENYLLRLSASQSLDLDSVSPMLGYVLRKTAEFKTVKMILVCIKSDARGDIQSRIRGI